MRLGLVAVLAAFSVGVWMFALIGVVTLATTIASPKDAAPTRPPSLLSRDGGAAHVSGADIARLPRFEDSARTEYRQGIFGDERVTEVEYVGEAQVEDVRSQYGTVFEREGWTVTSVSVLRGEWTYTVTSGERQATVEIERVTGATEVEIELIEPAFDRHSSTDR